jgi:hypothetical protein
MRCFDPVIASTSTLSSKTRKQAQQAGKLSLALSHSIRMRRLLSPQLHMMPGEGTLITDSRYYTSSADKQKAFVGTS